MTSMRGRRKGRRRRKRSPHTVMHLTLPMLILQQIAVGAIDTYIETERRKGLGLGLEEVT
jgi:hypothetical protein